MHLIPARGRILAALCLSGAALLLAQDWKTRSDVPGVDLTGLPPAKTNSALRLLRNHDCTCGCDMKVAQCRVEDPQCAYSKGLAAAIVEALKAGKSESDAVLAANASRWGTSPAPPKLLEAPVAIPVAGSPVTGAGDAPITLVEFSDFQCPYCSKAVQETKEVLKRFPKDVKLVFKQFPLDTHSEAEFGAEVALAAQAQGKFWEMHDLLYAGFPDISRARIDSYAKQLKLDMNRFHADVESHKYRARVQSEEKEGEDAGVGGTPTFFFNGKKFNGTFEVAAVVPLIKKELGQK